MAVASRHALFTRLLHAGLATAIILQLATSQVMDPDEGGTATFWVHQYVGLVAFALVLGFWIFGAVRQRGTPLGELFPWLSGPRRAAVWADIGTHWRALRQFHMPQHGAVTPLASAIHGLGLLLITAMAASGTLYYFVSTGDPDAGGLVKLAMTVHLTLANLVWAYLIGHAGLAVVNHITRTESLGNMWSLKETGK